MELLIVITLVGLIFSLGIYPIITQLKLFGVHRNEITLFDDANLVAYYITKDAMRATKVYLATSPSRLIFEYDRNPANTIIYSSPTATSLVRNGQTITNKFVQPASGLLSDIFSIPITARHQLVAANLTFKDPKNTTLETKRTFEVMLRCRDARL